MLIEIMVGWFPRFTTENLKALQEDLNSLYPVVGKPLIYHLDKVQKKLSKEIVLIGSEYFDNIRIHFPRIDVFTQQFHEKDGKTHTE
jgi:hypothetical protein